MNYDFKELESHIGHELECINYGDDNVSIECIDCGCVIHSVDKNSDNVKKAIEKVCIISEIDDENECINKWVFRDREKAQKFIEILNEINEDFEYDYEFLKFEDDFLEFNSDKSDLVGKCLKVTDEDNEFKSEIEVKSLSELIDDFGGYSHGIQHRNTIKKRIPNWLKYEDCSEIEETLKRTVRR